MKKRLFITAVVLAMAWVALVFCSRWFSPEPLHKGKPVSFWVDQAVTSYAVLGSYPAPYESRKEIKEIGPRAVPYLIEKLKSHQTLLWKRWVVVWNKLPDFAQRLTPKPSLRSPLMRAEAAEALAMLGPAAAPAVPELMKSLKDSNPTVVNRSAWALAAIGLPAKKAVPTLLDILPTQTPLNRAGIAWAIWTIDAQTNLALEEFMGAIKQKQDSGAVMNSAGALSLMGPAAAPATPVLIELLQDTAQPTGTRGNAASALANIGVSSELVLSNLMVAMNDSDPLIRLDSARSLWQLDRKTASNVVQLAIQCLKEPSPANTAAANLLGDLGKEAQSAIPALTEALQKNSPGLQEAATALEKIQLTGHGKAAPR